MTGPTIACLVTDIALAASTLFRGTRFVGGGGIGGGHPRVLGNALREVDRFTSLLADAVAAGLAPAGLDLAAFARHRNTARKLALLRRALDLPNPDDGALRAIGRSRDCLVHTGGIVRHRHMGTGPTAGWTRPDDRAPAAPTAIAVGTRIDIDPAGLARICRFYERIGRDLIALAEGCGRTD